MFFTIYKQGLISLLFLHKSDILYIVVNFIDYEGGKMFKLVSEYKPTGDQPEAIKYLAKGIEEGKKFQTLLGVTGSRKNIYNG